MTPTTRARKTRESVTRDARTVNARLDAKWFDYLDKNAAPAMIDYWLDLANNPPTLGTTFNFQLRDYRLEPAENAQPLLDHVRQVIASVALLPESAGYEAFGHNPFRLFHAVLETVPQGRIRECVQCKKFFFAKRKDQLACSPPCANVARQKRFREKWRAYERNRKRNRGAKNAALHREALRKLRRPE